MKNNNDVKINGFGSFYTKTAKPYIGKDLNTGKTKSFPGITYINFKPSKTIKQCKTDYTEINSKNKGEH